MRAEYLRSDSSDPGGTEAGSPTASLSLEQRVALQLALEGRNVFITGMSGTGKSFLVQLIASELQKLEKVVQVTAPTGLSAANSGGTTIHAFADIESAKGNEDLGLAKSIVTVTPCGANRWRSVDVLIIDEISLLSCEDFQKIEFVARYTRGRLVHRDMRELHPEPFGGVQVIVAGDFFMLPPPGFPIFCFESRLWDACQFDTINLRSNFRFAKDYADLLDLVRWGENAKEVRDKLSEHCSRPLRPTDLLQQPPVALHARHRHDRRKRILQYLEELVDETHMMFSAIDGPGFITPEVALNLDECSQAPASLQLKIGAAVVLLADVDVDRGLVRGEMGEVVAFRECAIADEPRSFEAIRVAAEIWYSNHDWLPVVQFYNGHKACVRPFCWTAEFEGAPTHRFQLPLICTTALTIRKAQGSTVGQARIDFNDDLVFEHGQVYVALSRVKSLDDVQIVNLKASHFRTNPRVVSFYKKLEDKPLDATSSSSDTDDLVRLAAGLSLRYRQPQAGEDFEGTAVNGTKTSASTKHRTAELDKMEEVLRQEPMPAPCKVDHHIKTRRTFLAALLIRACRLVFGCYQGSYGQTSKQALVNA